MPLHPRPNELLSMTNPSRSDIEVVQRAERLIRERGLAKNALIDSSGGVCATGALLIALGGKVCEDLPPDKQSDLWYVLGPDGPSTYSSYRDTLDRIMSRAWNRLCYTYKYGSRVSGVPKPERDTELTATRIVHWNNEVSRTAQDVAELFRELAEEMKHDEAPTGN